MPLKSGVSHAFGALASVGFAAVVDTYLANNYASVAAVFRAVGAPLAAALGGSLDGELAGALVLASALAFLWGTTYHLVRH
ncbi:hypothetical protein [Halobaculum sp. D14]|uniref:hypothetical protein n=1 Tax=unclassified Halobaculum TaxID=2640896 RepID=UPI003EBAFFB5